MNYESIKQELINNEIYKKVKDYSKNKSDLKTYYNVGKMLYEDGKHYGEGIIKKYSENLTKEIGKGFTTSSLKRMRQFYLIYEKSAPVAHQLTWSHYVELLPIKNSEKRNYYETMCKQYNWSKRELRNKIKLNEYERLDNKTKEKLINNEENKIEDFIKNPIVLKSNITREKITEKLLHNLILEDIPSFMKELGNGFSFIDSEYKINIGNRYNYIDLLLFNYIYNSFIVIELKVTEIKAEYIGQIKKYMNYIDKNIKTINQNNTIGIIICKKNNEFIMEYCSDDRIFNTTYQLI